MCSVYSSHASPLLGHVQRLSDLFNTESGADKSVLSPCSCTASEEQTFTMFDVTLAHCSIDDSEGLSFGRDHGSGSSAAGAGSSHLVHFQAADVPGALRRVRCD